MILLFAGEVVNLWLFSLHEVIEVLSEGRGPGVAPIAHARQRLQVALLLGESL